MKNAEFKIPYYITIYVGDSNLAVPKHKDKEILEMFNVNVNVNGNIQLTVEVDIDKKK